MGIFTNIKVSHACSFLTYSFFVWWSCPDNPGSHGGNGELFFGWIRALPPLANEWIHFRLSMPLSRAYASMSDTAVDVGEAGLLRRIQFGHFSCFTLSCSLS